MLKYSFLVAIVLVIVGCITGAVMFPGTATTTTSSESSMMSIPNGNGILLIPGRR